MHFAHENKAILAKMETFVNKQVQKMTEKFDFEQLTGEETREEEEDEIDEEDAIEVQSDDEEDNVESNETVVID